MLPIFWKSFVAKASVMYIMKMLMDNDTIPIKKDPEKPSEPEQPEQSGEPTESAEPATKSDQSVESQVVAPQVVGAETKKSKKGLTVALVFVLLGMLGGTAYYYFVLHKAPKYSASTGTSASQTDKPAKVTTVPTSNIPTKLLQNGQPMQGVAIGYLVGKQVATRTNPFEGQAYAASNNYQAAVFYDSSDGQISDVNVVTKATAKVTDDSSGATTPVFSSIDQKLAYTENDCSVAVMSVPTGVPTVIQKGDKSSTCYGPVAWSPDGKYLAYTGGTETQNQSLGLVNLVKLYIYDESTNTTSVLDTPSGFNSVGASDVYWQDATHIAVHYVDYGFAASIQSEKLTSVDVTNQQGSDLPTLHNLNYQSIQIVGNEMYATASFPGGLLYGPVNASSLQQVAGTDNTNTFLLQTDSSNSKVNSIYMTAGNPGTENSFKINQLNPNSGQIKQLYAPQDISTAMLGFGQSYDEIIYMEILSNKCEIHQYTISTDTDQVLVPNLPLIQQ